MNKLKALDNYNLSGLLRISKYYLLPNKNINRFYSYSKMPFTEDNNILFGDDSPKRNPSMGNMYNEYRNNNTNYNNTQQKRSRCSLLRDGMLISLNLRKVKKI